jgi:hypothetical protein
VLVGVRGGDLGERALVDLPCPLPRDSERPADLVEGRAAPAEGDDLGTALGSRDTLARLGLGHCQAP